VTDPTPRRRPSLLERVRAAHPASRHLAGEPADGGAALVLVLVVMLLGASLALLALAAVQTQVRPTQLERKYVRSLHASEAGAQVVLGRLQDSVKADPIVAGATVGDRSLLPCLTAGTTMTGDVGGMPGGFTYSATVRYYASDPKDQSDTWRAANALACPLAVQPSFALVESTGNAPGAGSVKATEADRTTELVYSFLTGTTNATGGSIRNGSQCWTAQPVAGALVTMSACSPGSATQLFSWRDDLTLVVPSSLATTPLCVTADRLSGTASQVQPYLAACDGLLHQSWGVNDSQEFYVFPQQSPSNGWRLCVSGGTLVATTGCATGFGIDQAVGSGRAGSISASQPGKVIQWVSYAEYGRCFDVNNWLVTNDLILFPCKQDPKTAALRWNQGWEYGTPDPVTGLSELSTYYGKSGEDYANAKARNVQRVCLDGSAVSGKALTLLPCSGAATQKVTVNREIRRTADGSLDYVRSYTIVDSSGRCLDVGPATPWQSSTNRGTVGWSSVVWNACSGSGSQKWNAPPTFTIPGQTGYREAS
jgi:hypothetical protein